MNASRISLGVRRIAFVFRFHVAAITQQPRIDIALQGRRAQDFGQPALSRPLPQLHLKQAVLSRHESLSKEQVVLVLGVDVSHAPTVAQHVYRLFAGPSTLSVPLTTERAACALAFRLDCLRHRAYSPERCLGTKAWRRSQQNAKQGYDLTRYEFHFVISGFITGDILLQAQDRPTTPGTAGSKRRFVTMALAQIFALLTAKSRLLPL